MKKLLLISIIAYPLLLFGQIEQKETLAKYIITEGEINNKDITSILTKAGAYTVFYTLADESLHLANVWSNSNTQSYGPMSNISSEKIEETDEYYETDIFYFDWHYTNTYDDESGNAKVEASTIQKPEGIFFIIEIFTDNLDKFIYKGYMEGTLNNNSFNKNSSNTNTTSRFRRDYTHVCFYDSDSDTWTEWQKGENTFVLNYNDNADIAHYKPSGDFVIYKNISNVEEATTESGEPYQILTALDEDGTMFRFQIFYNPKIGVKLIYSDVIIQFADH
jgi:hypothetical protein